LNINNRVFSRRMPY